MKYIRFFLLTFVLTSCSTVSQDISSEYYNIGNAYYDMGNYEKAIEYYNRALADGNDKENSIRYNLAIAYSKSDRVSEALKHFEFLLEQDPKNLKVLQSLAYTHFLLGDQERSLSVYNQILEIFEFDNIALFNKAVILFFDDKDGAEDALEKLYHIDPSSEVALLLGKLYEEREDWELFIELMERALIEDEGNVEILDSLAKYHERFKQYDKSLYYTDKIIESGITENLAALYFQKALIELLKMEDFEQGLLSLESALDSGFDDQLKIKALLENEQLENTIEIEQLFNSKGFYE